MRISLIAAVARNNVIGKDNQLLWHLPKDLKFFKEQTLGHHVIMGRKTYQSFNKPLPGRTNIVLTQSNALQGTPGITTAATLEQALNICRDAGETECFIAGGQKVYEIALPLADRLIITEVHAELEGDTYFPPFDTKAWKAVEKKNHPADKQHAYSFSFVIYEKR